MSGYKRDTFSPSQSFKIITKEQGELFFTFCSIYDTLGKEISF